MTERRKNIWFFGMVVAVFVGAGLMEFGTRIFANNGDEQSPLVIGVAVAALVLGFAMWLSGVYCVFRFLLSKKKENQQKKDDNHGEDDHVREYV